MVAAISVISAGLSIASSLNNLFGDDPTEELKQQMDQLLNLSKQLLTNVEANRQAIIDSRLSDVHSDMKQGLNAWSTFQATGLETDRQKAISKSTEALSDITSFSALSATEKTTLAPLMIATNALRLKVMDTLEDGATSGELKSELNGTISDLESVLSPLFDEAEQEIVVRIADVQYAGSGFPWPIYNITLEYLTASAPGRVSLTTNTFRHDVLSAGALPLPDPFSPAVGHVLDTNTYLAWKDALTNITQMVDDATFPVARLEFERAGGAELESLISQMRVLTSGEWHQGSDGVDDQLFSDSAPTYDKPDVLDGKGGDDVLIGGAGDDLLRGGRGEDLLLGAGGNDVLRGGADDDRIHGGDGSDVIDGGTGRDETTYSTSSVGVFVDLAIRDAQDTRQGLDTITNIQDLEGSDQPDTLRGDGQDNHIRGRIGNDWILGQGGDDTLEGEEGDDQLEGGAGIDTVLYATVDLSSNGVFQFAEIDLSLTDFQNTGDFGNDKLIGIENVTSGKGIDTLKGDENANHLKAGGGNDLLEGRLGDDTLDGGAGTDLAMFRGAANATIDLNITGPQNTGYGSDTLIGIEDLLTGGGADSLTGDGGDNRLMAGLGDDTLDGGGGDDFLSGGGGNDTALFDLTTKVTVDLSLNVEQDTGAGNDFLLDIENVTSGSGKDRLKGDDGNNVLRSGDGNDRLEGGLGDDSLIGGSGLDTAQFTGVVDTKVSLNKTGAQNTGHGMDRFVGIENVITGGGNDKLTGNNAKNKLVAGAGNDVLSGLGGNDVMNGGAGIDTALFKGNVDTEVSLATKRIQSTGHGNDRLIKIENVTTGGGDDELTGNTQDNVLNSKGGDDLLKGGKGDDTLIAGKGVDTLIGNGGGDTFVFAARDGVNTIRDFKNGVDKIEIRDNSATVTFADITVTDQGRDALVEYRGTDILLLNFNHNQIDATDFIF